MNRACRSLCGSSPRAWGTLLHKQPSGISERFIPTGVGNTASGHIKNNGVTVHPHGRGEHWLDTRHAEHWGGSSPRAWGTRYALAASRAHPRFIPTGVGNTMQNAGKISAQDGSSPRAWGTHLDSGEPALDVRFIPTGVGNTAPVSLLMRLAGVHPHGRGEHDLAARQEATSLRFIPTGVGNTVIHLYFGVRPSVHPHGRGEHFRNFMRHPCSRGSSPRAWGTRNRSILQWPGRRFIPTGVGNTPHTRPSHTSLAVHPHGRGEHIPRRAGDVPDRGSSPRAWGTLARAERELAQRRFIPTGVGNTTPTPCAPLSPSVHPHGRGEHWTARA